MDFNVFPTTPAALGTVAGAAVFCVVLVEVLKAWVAEKRLYNLIGMVVTIAIVEAAVLLLAQAEPIGVRLLSGFLNGLFGAALATLGYETITNLLGLAGIGSRAAPTK